MSIKPLSSLSLRDKNAQIQVQDNRKWEYRGTVDDGPILHVDMVFTDSMVNH
jgi:hypothetical protein